MKRKKLLQELEERGCVFVRHGSNHDLYMNPGTGRKAPIPRHQEIKDTLCALIRKQLGLN
ncbi:MAG TPA: type II toxin-antitoxin system HicA family toxin [Desulfonatronum sp.]|nr:type II toxin-antitoxin system HicA family toxin [Desulfonatronum sp.]